MGCLDSWAFYRLLTSKRLLRSSFVAAPLQIFKFWGARKNHRLNQARNNENSELSTTSDGSPSRPWFTTPGRFYLGTVAMLVIGGRLKCFNVPSHSLQEPVLLYGMVFSCFGRGGATSTVFSWQPEVNLSVPLKWGGKSHWQIMKLAVSKIWRFALPAVHCRLINSWKL